jgi:diadenosine tetraphosphate (Ap4A) HIT family hydrolase
MIQFFALGKNFNTSTDQNKYQISSTRKSLCPWLSEKFSYFTEIFFKDKKDTPKVQEYPCGFCNPKVIANQQIAEGRHFRVLVDYAPRSYGHLLFMPKRHVQRLHELNAQELIEFGLFSRKAAAVFQKLLKTEDYLVLEKNGIWQSVPHVHFHIIPIHGDMKKEKKYSELCEKLFNRATPMSKAERQKIVQLFSEAFKETKKKRSR